LRGFKELPDSVSRAFIYTGNTLNQIAIPGVLPFALPKVAAAMLIEYGANAYGHKGYRYINPFVSSGRFWPLATTSKTRNQAKLGTMEIY
jgi:hypothetical protein